MTRSPTLAQGTHVDPIYTVFIIVGAPRSSGLACHSPAHLIHAFISTPVHMNGASQGAQTQNESSSINLKSDFGGKFEKYIQFIFLMIC